MHAYIHAYIHSYIHTYTHIATGLREVLQVANSMHLHMVHQNQATRADSSAMQCSYSQRSALTVSRQSSNERIINWLQSMKRRADSADTEHTV